MKIAYLSSTVTLPGSPTRRDDAFEHDYMMQALRAPMAARGLVIEDIAWNDPNADWSSYGAAIIGTTWDYWDHQEAFLETLAMIETQVPLFNPSGLVRWNSHKTYLKDLAGKGARLIPTLWLDKVDAACAAAAFDTLGSDDLVFKRQVGAGAFGQHRLKRGEPVPDMPHPMMVQPFLEMIQREGEYSFVFIDGAFCHALIKRAAPGDYRIQSSYGGMEEAITPSASDLTSAEAILATLETPPLYARVDMLRGADGGLLLMELELIEPYLYPLQGPELGERMALGLLRRLGL
ncbi:MAG: hypothetical protein GYB42_10615 [Alphaproteobacteria bacterium]|nr:hypothetical protein [Alphaproteobacteria bacterium]